MRASVASLKTELIALLVAALLTCGSLAPSALADEGSGDTDLLANVLANSGAIVSADVALGTGGDSDPEPVVGSFVTDGMLFAVVGEGEAQFAAIATEPDEEGLPVPAHAQLVEEVALGDGTQEPAASERADAGEPETFAIPPSVSHEGVEYAVAAIGPNAFYGTSYDRVAVPASVVRIDHAAFRSPYISWVEVDPENLEYASFDGALYSADLATLRLIPEGRVGAVRIASSVTEVDPEVFSHCPSVDSLVADADSAAYKLLEATDLSGKTLSASEGMNQAFESRAVYGAASITVNAKDDHVHENNGIYGYREVYGGTGRIEHVDDLGGDPTHTSSSWRGFVQHNNPDGSAYLRFALTVPGQQTLYTRWCTFNGIQCIGFSSSSVGGSQTYDGWTITESSGIIYAVYPESTFSLDKQGGSGGTSDPVTARVAEVMPSIAPPERDGFKFGGYYSEKNGGGTRYYDWGGGSANVWDTVTVKTLYAHWIPVTYRISYELNGGTVDGANPTSYTIESNEITLKNPKKDGCAFAGWTGSNGSTKQTSVKIPEGSTGNKSYIANWTPISYSITYNLNGGTNSSSNPGSYTVESDTITLKDPTRTGYTFGGWYSDSGFRTRVTSIAKGSTENKTLYAKWVLDPTLDANGGGIYGYREVYDGTGRIEHVDDLGGDPTHTSSSWRGFVQHNNPDGSAYLQHALTGSGQQTIYTRYCKYNGIQCIGFSSQPVGGSQTSDGWTITEGSVSEEHRSIYAVYPESTFSLDKQGGSGGTDGPLTARVANDMPSIAPPTRAGFEFGGYWSQPNGRGTRYYEPSGAPAQKWDTVTVKTLYAKWVLDPTLDANGGGIYGYREVYGGTGRIEHVDDLGGDPTHTSSSWRGFVQHNNPDGSAYLQHALTGSGQQTIYTRYCKYNGIQCIGFSSQPVGGSQTSDGWTITEGSVSEEHRSIYAVYPESTFSLDKQGGSGGTDGPLTARVANDMPSIAPPTRAGFEFGGYWSQPNGRGTKYYEPSGAPAQKWDTVTVKTLYAKWIPHAYTIALDPNGEGATVDPASIPATYDEDVTLPMPMRAGYIFSGWNTERDSSGSSYASGQHAKPNLTDAPDGTVTLYAEWVPATSVTVPLSVTLAVDPGNDGADVVVADWDGRDEEGAFLGIQSANGMAFAVRSVSCEPVNSFSGGALVTDAGSDALAPGSLFLTMGSGGEGGTPLRFDLGQARSVLSDGDGFDAAGDGLSATSEDARVPLSFGLECGPGKGMADLAFASDLIADDPSSRGELARIVYTIEVMP